MPDLIGAVLLELTVSEGSLVDRGVDLGSAARAAWDQAEAGWATLDVDGPHAALVVGKRLSEGGDGVQPDGQIGPGRLGETKSVFINRFGGHNTDDESDVVNLV
jgi:hypothetical protein